MRRHLVCICFTRCVWYVPCVHSCVCQYLVCICITQSAIPCVHYPVCILCASALPGVHYCVCQGRIDAACLHCFLDYRCSALQRKQCNSLHCTKYTAICWVAQNILQFSQSIFCRDIGFHSAHSLGPKMSTILNKTNTHWTLRFLSNVVEWVHYIIIISWKF